MEELFEAIIPLVIIFGSLLLKKNKNGGKAKAKKPGRAEDKQHKTLEDSLADVEKKLQNWAEKVADALEEEELDVPVAAETPAAQPDTMAPQYLQSEPLVAERLQESGMPEGLSHTDPAGCIGGSLLHDENAHHQGQDFHPAGAHSLRRDAREAPVQTERVKPAVSAAQLRQAVLWKEILDAPVSMRE